jgi:hypothetical protein
MYKNRVADGSTLDIAGNIQGPVGHVGVNLHEQLVLVGQAAGGDN